MGQRAAALHGVGASLSRGEAPLLIVGAEATVPLYPAPSAFKSEPPVLRRGQDVDLAAFREQLITVGYCADERIDEPGEVGEAGVVLDIFPVDSAVPVRVEVEFGAVRSIRHYDALTQASSEEVERAAFGIAAEPPLGADAVPLPQHIPGALWLVDPAFAKARAPAGASGRAWRQRPHAGG